MARKTTPINIQIIDEKLGERLELFPASKSICIIIREDPLMTLDEWMSNQEKRNERYDKTVERVNAYERSSTQYVVSKEAPQANPEKHLLWAEIVDEVEAIPNSCNCGNLHSMIDILPVDPEDPKPGYIWILDEDVADPIINRPDHGDDPEESCGCEEYISRVDILKNEPASPRNGYMWLVRGE